MLFTIFVTALLVWAVLQIAQQISMGAAAKQALPIAALLVIGFLWALVAFGIVAHASC